MPRLPVPSRFHQHFELVQYIASGQCGDVYKARAKDGSIVALKVFDKQQDKTILGYFTNEQLLLRVINEHHAHPHLATYIESNLVRPPYFLATRFVEGGRELQSMLGKLLPPGFVAKVIEQTASALDYLHQGHPEYSPIIHRDIKPTNLLIDAAGDVVVIDLSIARHPGYAIADEPGLGTIPYMAPEQYTGCEQPATDQFALALVALHMLTGRALLPNNVKKAQQKIAALRDTQYAEVRKQLGVRSQTADALCKALAFEPTDRFPSCVSFAEQLRVALVADGQSLAQSAAPQQAPSRAVWGYLAMAATGVGAVVMLVVALLNIMQGDPVVAAATVELRPVTTVTATTTDAIAPMFRSGTVDGPASISPTTTLVDVPTVVPTPTQQILALPRPTITKKQPRVVMVGATSEPLRAGPSTNTRILMRMSKGTQATRTGREQKQRSFTWYEVVYEGRTGWCRSTYCKQTAGVR